MKAVEVKEQVSLPLSKCLELVLSGLRYRLFRAIITVTVISLAVAFLMVMLSESLISERVIASISQKTQPRRDFDRWVSRLSKPINEKDLTDELAALSVKDEGRWAELRDWGKLDDARMDRLVQIARRQKDYSTTFFDQLSDGRRRKLVNNRTGPAVFAYLRPDSNFAAFETKMKDSDVKLPMDEFRAFMGDWRQTAADRESILKGHAATLPALRDALGTRTVVEALAADDPKLLAAMKAEGYRLSETEQTRLRDEANFNLDASSIRQSMNTPGVKQRFAERLTVTANEVDYDKVFAEVSSEKGARWLVDMASDIILVSQNPADAIKAVPSTVKVGDKPLPVDDFETFKSKPLPQITVTFSWVSPQLVALAQREALVANLHKVYDYNEKVSAGAKEKARWRTQREAAAKELGAVSTPLNKMRQERAARIAAVAQNRIEGAGLASIETAAAHSTLGGRTVWLIVVSFLVCVVGIANAMLMSVTERFREIATMKCLGATDIFIMINFILESVMQGIAGGIVGAIIGLILGVLRCLASYGSLVWGSFPPVEVLEMAGLSLLVGVVVSALAAVYPAYAAARLAPMEAMRIE